MNHPQKFIYRQRQFVLTILALFSLLYNSYSQNAIVSENALTGSPPSAWDIDGAGDLSIQGFATDISINKGQTVHFKINTDASAYTVTIYRLGYYQGNGARQIGTGVITAALPQNQPIELYDPNTGMTDCGNWNESAHWDIPSNAVSGLYFAKLTRTDNGGSSHIMFIVRDDASHADVYFKTSDVTWHAYNVYGGNSLYVGSTSYASGHATKVSYNRPFVTRNGGGGGGVAEDWLFNAEYPMIRFLERNGYDLSYTTDVDADRRGNLLLNHKAIISVGHDEYWSGQERTNWETARNAGVHMAFFSGNEIYWKTRWEASTDGTNTPYRTLVCYKEGTLGENICGDKCDPMTDSWTGLWRDGCNYPAADGCNPENALSGQISWDGTTGAIQVPDTYKNLRFWRNTSIATLGSGQTATLSDGTLGYEWDWEQYQASYPAGRIQLSGTLYNSHVHHLSLYRHSSGALVFGAGTVQWSWGLDGNHDRGGSVEDIRMQQATVNLFADMGIQPGTMMSGLVPASASTDIQAPVSIITSPAPGTLLPNGSHVTIAGTASDAVLVAGVEVSTDGGATWLAATGTTNWTFTWVPTTEGPVVIKSRAFDDSGNMETEGTASAPNAIVDTVSAALPVVCPCTIFQPTDAPAVQLANDNQSIELGVKFRSTEDGYITGVRFYKGAGTTGIHLGHVWSGTGTLLAEATFTNESASGWQEVLFGTPVAVTSGTTFVASYFSTSGDYPYTDMGLTSPVINGPLRALAEGEDGPNGVYRYNDEPIFPTNYYQSSNYWVDIVFDTYVGPDTIAPSVIAVSPAAGAGGVNVTSDLVATFSEAIDPSTLNGLSFELYDASNALLSAAVSYNSATHKAILNPTATLAYSTVYHATVKGGIGYQRIKDIAGNAMPANFTWSFTTSSPPPPPPTEGPGGPILLISAASNPFSRYPVEILRAEGYNEFTAMDISQVNAGLLDNYDVIIVGNIPLSAADVTMLTNWTNAGGTLIALRPDAQLAGLLGVTPASGTLDDKYLLVNTAAGPGIGIVNQTMQFHSSADLYILNGATSLATLYSNATTPTAYPAVTSRNVGSNGGQAFAFTYDLARSIVYTRQGNPLWAGQKRDGQIDPIRSDDMFFPDWIDFNKVAIPQADEQQHLLSNIILKGNLHRKPLPKFWFLPKGLKAAIVMTGDDHGDAGMQPRFDIDIAASTPGCSVENWDCIRSTGYLYVGSIFNDSMAKHYNDLGFEVALHVLTNCGNYSAGQFQNFITNQMSVFTTTFPSIPVPTTNRNHCIAWSDFSMPAEIEAANGIRFDVNYYYWPDTWVQDRPGMFTGSGMPMRFAKTDGTIIDCYQAATQMPDESGESFPQFCDALLDKAIGPEGYYGVFTTNMHFDNPNHPSANAVVASAKAHGIPVVTAKQMLDWVDGRNGSSFGSMVWNSNALSFTVSQGAGALNLKGMLPFYAASGQLTGITFGGSPVTFATQTIKGISYAFFNANAGSYIATYSTIDTTAPHITTIVATPHNNGTATITWTTDETSSSTVDYAASPATLTSNTSDANLVTSHSILLNGLTQGTTYHFRVSSADVYNNNATSPLPPDSISFTMPTGPCVVDQTTADFISGSADANTAIISDEDGAVALKPSLDEEFSAASIPAGWIDAVWDGQAGAITTYSGGQLTVNGTHLATTSTFAPGTSVEFSATFTAGNFQNVGFTANAAFDAPWVVIGRGAAGDGNIYARTSDNQAVVLGGGLLGTPHVYKIKWNAGTNNFEFYVDGALISTTAIVLTSGSNMNVQISDYPAGGVGLTVDWVRITPYAASGSFTSRVFDGGAAKDWGLATWNATIPSGTALSVYARKGNTSVPDGTWSSFVQIPSSGSATGGTSRYIQYRADLSTSNNAFTPVFKDISIACTDGTSDVTPPVITNISATPSPDGTAATITWTTDETSNSVVNYGTSSGSLSQNSNNASGVTSHTITITGLTPGTTYYYDVTSEDLSGNSSTAPALPLSFATPVPMPTCFADNTFAEFSAGTTGGSTYVSLTEDGEVILTPSLGAEFNGGSTPVGWGEAIWGTTTGASVTYSGGHVAVSGAHTYSNATFGPGSTIEFVATYSSDNFQNVGFTADADFNAPWIVIGRGGAGDNNIYARTSDGQSGLLGGTLLNSSHRFKIKWNAGTNDFAFFVDGVLIATPSVTQTVSSNMNVQISDYPAGGPGLTVDWLRVTPFTSTGTFESRIYDGGAAKNWGDASWTADVPSGTSLGVSVRKGDTPIPDGTWSSYEAIAASGNSVGGTSRYIQYKIDLTTSDNAVTPVFKNLGITCGDNGNVAPAVSSSPASLTLCEGSIATFVSKAGGSPFPTIQWQESTNGGINWNNISGATSDTLRFNSALADNNKLYRAVWTNTSGSVISDSAALIEIPHPSSTIAAVSANSCQGDSIRIQLLSAASNPPYNLVMNGVTYSGVYPGQTFAGFGAVEKSIWGNTGSPANPAVTDNQPIEIGVKFRTTTSGYIRGVRFYKGTGNTGTHIGSLWSSSGTQLATATFTSETASGWQEVHFATPVLAQANTTYIASYYSPDGYFAINAGFFSSTGISNPPLTALAAGVDGSNGVYRYGAGGGFPNGGNTANYWVDVLFEETYTTPQTFTYNLTSVTDSFGCISTGAPLSSTSAVVNPKPVGVLSAPANTCMSDSIQLTYTSSAGTGPYTLTINGTTYPDVTSGVPFNSGTLPATGIGPISIWDSTTIGGEPSVLDADNIELGVKFRSAMAGQITGIRFYKWTSNTGTHTGTLWSAGGAQLATATFTNETASGWQKVNFSSPVNIAANTTYIASYHAPVGNYAFNSNYFASTGVTNGPLTALQTGVDGPNGVYKYASGTVFPDQSFNNANYWVDAVFTASASNVFSLTGISDATGCSTSGNPISTAVTSGASASATTVNDNVCMGHSYTFNGTTLPWATILGAGGIFTDTLTGSKGCDSVVTLHLSFLSTTTSTTNAGICAGNSYNFNGHNYSAGGIYQVTLQGSNGCDSVATLNLTVHPLSSTFETRTSCNPADTGVVVLHLTNVYGCDSTHTITTTLLPSSATSESKTTCNPANVGVVVLHLTNVYGCDSTHTITTTLNPTSATSEIRTSCNPADTGVVVLHLTNAYGCDSTHTITTTLNPTSATTENRTSCNAGDTGVVVLHLSNVYGCDSTHTITTTLLPSSATSENRTTCNPANVGVVVLHLTNAYGCDSTHTITTTLNPTSATTENRTSCNPADTGVVVLHLTNANGCDSTHTITTTLNPTSATTENRTSCNAGDTGVVVLHLTNVYGCDSTHTVTTTFLPSSATSENRTTCNPANVGVVVLYLTNVYGCDSTHTITTALNLTSATSEIRTSCNPANTGVVVLHLTNVYGCDSTHTITTTLLPSSATAENRTSCNPADTGVVVLHLTNAYGCDSTHTITTTLNPTSATAENRTSCNPADTGVVVLHLTNAYGCDSTHTITTTLSPTSATTENRTSCNPADTGVVVLHLTNSYGCDSTHTITTTLLPSSATSESKTTCNPANVGVVVLHLTNAYGCDSTHTITTTLNPTSATSENRTSCNPADTGVVVLHLVNVYGCDSTHTITTALNLTSATTENRTSCNPANTGVVVLHLTNVYGCDSTHTITTTLLPSSATAENRTSCNPADTGVVVLHLTNAYGCDSTHTITTTLNPASATTENRTSCNATDTGVVVLHLTNVYGCDSTHTITTTLNPTSATTENRTSCNPADIGVVVLHLTNAYGCDSTHTITTTLNPTSATSENRTSCNAGDTGVVVLHLTNVYGCDSTHTITTTLNPISATSEIRTSCNATDTGVVVLHLTNVYGCDSTHTITTTLNPTSATTENRTSCNPADTGVVVLHLTNAYGCDSTHTITTTLNPTSATSEIRTSCNPADTGVVVLHLTNVYGCDSTHTVTTTLNQTSATSENRTSCNPSDTGVVVLHLTNVYGCDSTHAITTTLNPTSATSENRTSCNAADTGVVVLHLTNVYGCDSTHTITTTLNPTSATSEIRTSCNATDTGVVVLHLTNVYGCDSTHTITTTLNPTSATSENRTSCNPSDTGVVVLHLTNVYGCDSTHTITTTLNPTSATSENRTSCNPADTGIVVLHLTNVYGCDSTHTITTTLNPKSATSENRTSCNPADTGVAVLHLTNVYGCDSTHTITTTLNPTSATSEIRTSCNPGDTGIVVLHLTNAYGCDSTHTVTTTLNQTSATSENRTSCNPSDTGVVVLHLTNVYGCDSTHAILTTLNPTSTTSEIRTSCNATDTGVVVLHLMNVYGCDSIHTITTTLLPISATIENRTSCNPADTGTVILHLTNMYGCDSIHRVVTTLLPTNSSITSESICSGSSYNFNGVSYSVAGLYTALLTSSNGCDSVAMLNLTVLNAIQTVITDTACGSYTLNGQNYSVTGVYSQTLISAIGCDSIVILNLTIHSLPVFTVSIMNTKCGLSNGAASASILTPSAYTFTWSNGDSIPMISNLDAGFYSVTVGDNAGCSYSENFEILSSVVVVLDSSATHTSCDNNNGVASVSVVSGSAPYMYLWNNAATSPSISNLAAGAYVVTVTDAEQCSAVDSIFINPSTAIAFTVTTDKTAMCPGDTANICSPVGYASYLWNTGDTTSCIQTQNGGDFSVTVSDQNGCQSISSSFNHVYIIINPTPNISIEVYGDSLILVEGTVSQWYFNGQPIAGAISQSYIASQPGNYSVYVTDSVGCGAFSNWIVIGTGINEPGNSWFKIYPNPLASGNWILNVDEAFVGSSFEIYDANGRLVYNGHIESETAAIEFDPASGVYFLKVSSGKTNLTFKLLRL